jgi:O-antigen/teichoic acid export membrane protein
VTRGFRWSLAGQLLSRVGVFATGIMLARTLTPHDFGVYAVALAAFNLLMMVNEVGMVTGIVRAPEHELESASRTGATLAFAMSVVVATAAFVAAPWFASALGAPDATGVLRLLVVSVLVDGAMTVPMALLARTFQQRRITQAEALGLLAYMASAITLALGGAGPWSIAVGRVFSSLVTAGMLLVFSPRLPRPGFDRVQARKLLRFGIPLTLAALVAEAVLNADYLVVGKVLGAVSLGIYLLAYNLSTWPVSAVLVSIGRVAFAGFARLTDDRERMARAFTRAVGIIVAATVPLALLLGLLAPEAINLIYGARWLGAVTPLRFLLVLAVARVVIQTTLDYIAAAGRPVVILRVQLVWLIVLVPALILGAERYGIRGVGLAHMAVVVFVVTPLVALALHRAGVDIAQLARQFVRPVLAAVVAGIVIEGLLTVVTVTLPRLLVVGGAGAAAYLAMLVPFNPLVAWAWTSLRGRESVSKSPTTTAVPTTAVPDP